jgi:uncharacterized repeat protein (TIGR04138 family)
MQSAVFEEVIEKVVQRDARYHRDAYVFVREALTHTQKRAVKETRGSTRRSGSLPERHVSGQELLAGIREFGLAQFGPMAKQVLNEWGVWRCEDFGEIVFNLIEADLLRKTDQDSRGDFRGGYDFDEAFCQPFRPSTGQLRALPESQVN